MYKYLAVNLSERANRVGVNKHTAYGWYREGKLPVPAQRVGKLILENIDGTGSMEKTRSVSYARVSSSDQRSDLERQVARLVSWVSAAPMAVDKVVTEVGSGMNAQAPKFERILADSSASNIIVEHRDRLARFGSGESGAGSVSSRAPDRSGRR